MRRIARVVSWLSLVGVVAPSFMYLSGGMSLAAVKTWMLLFSTIWFATVPIWMDRK